jgi:phosphoribosylpyrophosphate synthetase
VIVFCLPQHRVLLPVGLDGASDPALGRCRLGRFPDGELWLELEDPVAGRDCALLGSLAPPGEQTLSTLLLADTLRRAGARRWRRWRGSLHPSPICPLLMEALDAAAAGARV